MADQITTRLKLKDVYPDLTDEYGEEAVLIRKGITPADLDVKEDERAIISYINTAAKDRDGEIVLPSGADLTDYRKNPVVLFGHRYHDLPIGKNMWIKADEKGLIAKTQYANHEEAEKVYQYRKDGFPLAESVGFIPLEYKTPTYKNGEAIWDSNDLEYMGLSKKDLKGVRAVYTKWSMLEYSDVAVPSNPEALELAKAKGLIKEDQTIVKVHPQDCTCPACQNARKNMSTKTKKKNQDGTGDEDPFAAINASIEKLKEETRTLQEERAYQEIKNQEIEKTAATVFSGLRDECQKLMDEVRTLREEKKALEEKEIADLPPVIQDVFDQLADSVKEVAESVKTIQAERDKERKEKEYFTFPDEEYVKEEPIDYKDLIGTAIREALSEQTKSTQQAIKEGVEDTMARMKGVVVKKEKV